MSSIADEFKKNPIRANSSFSYKYVEIAAKLRAAGFSLEDVGYAFGFKKGTIDSWSRSHPQFKRALEDGKEIAKSHVVAKAFKAACGYEYEDYNEKWEPNKESGELELKQVSKFKKHQPPNPKLIMWLLCNLSPEQWKSEHKILIENEKHITVKLDGKVASKQIAALAGKLLDEPEIKRKKVESVEITANK